MRICEKHFEALKRAIIAAGLGDMIKQKAQEAAADYQMTMTGQQTPGLDTFCPLFHAQILIYSQAIQMTGGACLHHQAEPWQPHYCPVCEAEAKGCNDWIVGPVSDVVEYAKQLPQNSKPPFKSGCQTIADTIRALSVMPYWIALEVEKMTDRQLVRAADCYMLTNQLLATGVELERVKEMAGQVWPLDRAAFTPSANSAENLALAGALIAIELGRLNQAAQDRP